MFMVSLCLLAVNGRPVPPIKPETLRLWRAICLVESGGDAYAVNRAEGAVGIAQIRRGYVDDCNRIVGESRWSYSDRYCPAKSLEMFLTYSGYYAPAASLETLARTHNGGPQGARKASTLRYWQRVKAQLLRIP
jgi:hypothetical protein